MPDLKIYFTDDEDDLRRWFKETYGREGSQIIKTYIQNLKEGKTEPTDQPTKLTVAELERIDRIITAQFNAPIMEGEEKYLARMKKDEIDTEAITKARLRKIETAEPTLYPAICEQLKNTLPRIAKIGGLSNEAK